MTDVTTVEPPPREAPAVPEGEGNVTLSWPSRTQTTVQIGLLIIAVFGALYVARPVFLPIMLAVIFSLLLSPAVRFLKRYGLPEPLGAAIVLAILVGAVAIGVWLLAAPAHDWLQRAPQSIQQVKKKVAVYLAPILKFKSATEQAEGIATGAAPPKRPADGPAPTGAALTMLVHATGDTAANLVIMLVLLFFLLSSGDMFLTKVVRLAPNLHDKKRAVEIFREMEGQISRYLVYVTMINAGLGASVGLCLWLLKMPNALLWGTMAFVINFVPYLGGTAGIIIVAIVGLLTFDSIFWGLLPAFAYWVCFFIEGNFVTPGLLGKGLRLNPVMIFSWLTLWTWMWGVFGALLAVPILVILKILCDHMEPLAPVGEFLGE